MVSPDQIETLSIEVAARVTELARACRAAMRIVTLYPASHPSIAAALGRVTAAGREAVATGPLPLTVLPDALHVNGRRLARPETAVSELAREMHDHLIGTLTLEGALDERTWHRFLSILSRAPEQVRAEGGVTVVWLASGGGPLTLREIDYGEVLKDRSDNAETASWDRIIASYLTDDDRVNLDEQTLAALLDIATDPQRLAEFLERLQTRSRAGGEQEPTARRSLLQLMHGAINYAAAKVPADLDRLLTHMAGASAHLSPDMMLALLTDPPPAGVEYAEASPIDLAAELRSRVTDEMMARAIAIDVEREDGATARLATVFHTLVPDGDRGRVLSLAAEQILGTGGTPDPNTLEVWQRSLDTLMSYSDSAYVPDVYARELTLAQNQATEVERVSDDPPERISAWLSTMSDEDVRALDQQMILDLLAIETRPDAWAGVLKVTTTRIEQLVLVGDLPLAGRLIETIVGVAQAMREPFADLASQGLSRLVSGPLPQNLVLFLRHADERETQVVGDICLVIGPTLLGPLAQALGREQNPRTVRRLRDVLIGFGSAARAYAAELRESANPEARRAAVDLLRTLGGDDALPDLRSLLDDTEPQVQRDALRAIVQLGTNEAYGALEQALKSGVPRTRDAIMQALSSLRDERASALFVYILAHADHRGGFEGAYLSAIAALGRVGSEEDAIGALRLILHRGEWWAPLRTGRLRLAAARALKSIGNVAAERVLQDAAQAGSGGVRRASRTALSEPSSRDPLRRTS